jgi:hypothetical protein
MYLLIKTSVNSIVCRELLSKKLAGFGFQNAKKPGFLCYKYPANFPKLFLIKNVEKKGKPIRTGIPIAYPHCVNI